LEFLVLLPRRTVLDGDFIEQRLDEEPDTPAHFRWQFEISHIFHSFTPTSAALASCISSQVPLFWIAEPAHSS
jgi:hypothetical protein